MGSDEKPNDDLATVESAPLVERVEAIPVAPPPRAPRAPLATRLQGHWLPEFLLRMGLLLGAMLFFLEGVGSPLSRNLFALAGLLLSALVVTTLVFQWRVLGDWRLGHNQALYGMLALVLAFPITAAVAPGFGTSMVPDLIEQPMVEVARQMKAIPGLGAATAFIRGIIAFFFVVTLLLILMLTSGPGRRGGLVFVSVLLLLVVLFFHPSAETIVGFLLLGAFLHAQWEIPLIIPPRVREFLRPAQLDFLMELIQRGPVTTGETRLLLENDPNRYAELMELKLVEFDPVTREVVPGERLLNDPASSTIGAAFDYARRTAWVMVGLIYVLLPDFLPGPIDDLIVLGLCVASGFGLLPMLRPGRGLRRR